MGIESICENFYLSTMDESFYRNHWISINVISNEIGNETKKRNFSLKKRDSARIRIWQIWHGRNTGKDFELRMKVTATWGDETEIGNWEVPRSHKLESQTIRGERYIIFVTRTVNVEN